MNHGEGGRRWVWVFAEIAGLRWVAQQKQMAFPASAAVKAARMRKGDRAVLYTSRGAFHNPSRDEARLVGLATVTGPCEPVDGLEIAGREFTWTCPITVDLLLPDRQGPRVRDLAARLDRVKRPEAWGGYFRNSPVEVNEHDWSVLVDAVRQWRDAHAEGA